MLKEFKNTHSGQDIYILASGKSVDFVNNSFFDNKIVIGINQAYKKVPCQYLIRKEGKLTKEVIDKNPKSYIFLSQGDCGGNNTSNLSLARNLSNNDRVCMYKHPPRGEIRLCENQCNRGIFPTHDDYLVVSFSTITTGIHLAAYMGAKNIILVGHDCGTLDGKPNFDGYHNKQSYSITHKNGEGDYIDWLKHIENQTIGLKKIIQMKYGCNIYSLNPFINFGLEGHIYQK